MHCVARIVSYSYYRNAACSMLLLLLQLLREREHLFNRRIPGARAIYRSALSA